MRRLLFLNGIKAFEAAARTGSFAAAGTELNVSAAAVSRMVHLLEERLGVHNATSAWAAAHRGPFITM